MSEEELCREIKSGAFSMQVADCERNIRIQFEQLQQENKKYKEVIEKAIEYIKNNATSNYFDKEKTMFRREEDLLEILNEVK